MMKTFQQDTTPSQEQTQSSSGQRILFTGPDGVGDFRPRLDYFPRSIGIGPLSPDATSDLNYLFRPAPRATPPSPKHCFVGEVGWGLQYSTALNRRTVINSKQYELDRFQSAVLDEVTHSPWQNQSQFHDKQLTCGKLAWNHSTHDAYSKEEKQQFPLNQSAVLCLSFLLMWSLKRRRISVLCVPVRK
uniref:Peptidylprolyl isomerase D n=1 Tax=Cyprinus carpio carpio TaxID=630221 RepID=A0A9J8CHK6_CYPCA